MKKTMRKPEDWQAFERLCKKLFGEVWSCPNTIKKNGRSGQAQSGVDVYGIPKGEITYYGIQCKGKDDYTQAQLTESEITEEIKKAQTFQPQLKVFVIATSANKDVHIETFIRLEDVKSRESGSFEIVYYAWEDLVDLIEENRETFQWYIAEQKFRDKHDVDVKINDQDYPLIQPEYIRDVKIYRLARYKADYVDLAVNDMFSQLNHYSSLSNFIAPAYHNSKRQFNYAWCPIKVTVKNTGSQVIEDWKINLSVEKEKVKAINEEYEGEEEKFPALSLALLKLKYQNKTTWVDEDDFSVIYKPLNQTLIQKDKKTFSFWLLPIDHQVASIIVNWELLARDFSANGTLSVNVNPQFERKIKEIEVENDSELRDKEESFREKVTDKK